MIKDNIEMIVCMAANRVIGLHGRMPWEKPKEYHHFLQKIDGHNLIFGRKNYNLNLSNNKLKEKSKKWLFFSRNSVDKNCYKNLDTFFNDFQMHEKYMVLGGEKIYELFLPYTRNLYLTILDDEYDGDCFFPLHEHLSWEIVTQNRDEDEAWTYYHLKQS